MFVGVGAAVAVSFAQTPAATVRITADRANVRASPAADAPVLQQVWRGSYLFLMGEAGAWFQVQLPPNPRMPGIRAVGYVSKTVATLVTGAEASAAAEAAKKPAVRPPGDTIAVGADHGGRTTWLKAVATRAVAVREAVASPEAMAASPALAWALGGGGAGPTASRQTGPPADAADVTWVWATAVDAPAAVLSSRRPSFFVSYGEVAGLNASEWAPGVIRLLPVGSGWRFVSAAPGSSHAKTAGEADWPLARVLVQASARTSLAGVAAGMVNVTLAAPLDPGEYALVIRPALSARRYAPRDVLGDEGPGVAFGAAWVFVVK